MDISGSLAAPRHDFGRCCQGSDQHRVYERKRQGTTTSSLTLLWQATLALKYIAPLTVCPDDVGIHQLDSCQDLCQEATRRKP